MRTSKVIQSSLTVLALLSGVFAVGLLVAGLDYGKPPPHVQATPEVAQSSTEDSISLDYRVWRVFPEDRRGFTTVVVSVNPRHFNRDDMTALAAQLNREFADRTKLKVGLLDDADTARLFVEGRANYPTYERAERGRYYLDRSACREYIQFSTQREQPRRTIRLNCSRQQRR